MRRPSIKALALAGALSLAAGSALAVPVQWTVSGVTFPNGGVVSGSFVYDADINGLTSIAVTTTTDSDFTGQSYSVTGGYLDSGQQNIRTISGDSTALPGLIFSHAAPLTNAGGTVNLNATYEGACVDATCTTVNIARSRTLAGTLTGTPLSTNVPTLSEWAMIVFAALLGGMAMVEVRRRRLLDGRA